MKTKIRFVMPLLKGRLERVREQKDRKRAGTVDSKRGMLLRSDSIEAS